VLKAWKYLLIAVVGIAQSFIYTGCSSTRKLKENEILLNRLKVKTNNNSLNTDEIYTYIKQKPNRKFFGVIPFYLEIYNLVDQDKLKSQKLRRDLRLDRINAQRKEKNLAQNEKRKAKGKSEKPYKLKNKDRLTFREWLVNIGEEPSIYDSTLARKSVKQISLYLDKKGYFNNQVRDSVVIREKKAKIFYLIKVPQPFTIRHINYEIEDNLVSYFVLADSTNSLVRSGQICDGDIIQKERDRITKTLKNNGYFYFTKEYIYFTMDSSLKSHQLDLTIGIKNQTKVLNQKGDSTIEVNHERYEVNDIYIITDYRGRSDGQVPRDTLRMEDSFIFLYHQKLHYKTNIIRNAIFLHKGELYQDQNYEATYKRLSELRAFKQVTVELVPAINGQKDQLDCVIRLTPVAKQFITVAGEGINTGGNLGVTGSVVYQNKNTLKGAEILELKMKAALEVEKLVTNIGTLQNQKIFLPFNTYELGPEINLYVPRALFPFNLFLIRKSSSPRTTFTSYYNFQQRPDYTRSILNMGYSYQWRNGMYKKYILFPFEVNLVKLLHIDPVFQNYLNEGTDPYLRRQFQDHFTTDTRWTYTYTNQELKKKKNYWFFRLDLEASGNLLRSMFDLSNKVGIPTAPKDLNGSYRIDGIEFSQYVKGGFDVRYYKFQSEHNRLVIRAAAGIGVPFANLNALPFEKSYFVGGPNSVRAFQARSIGPGSFNQTNATAYELGDMDMEANIEYRYKIFKMLNAAIFVDAGNIWLQQKDPQRPGAEFETSRFYKEFALGTGLGLRLDFDFFIIRLDAGVPLRNPVYPENDRWMFNKQPIQRTNLNFGIGYPF
jgi:outer membrane protein assembly factor BamA